MSDLDTEPKFPAVTVKLTGKDGNAFSIMGRVATALRKAEASADEIIEYLDEARSGDYDTLLRVTLRWVKAR